MQSVPLFSNVGAFLASRMRKVLEQGGTGSQHVRELAVPALWKESWLHVPLSAWVSWEWHR